MKYLINGLDMFFSGIIMYILYPFFPKDIWIISERLDQAQDNGIAFFEYINKEHSNIASYYLLEKNCPNINYVKSIGKVLIQGTLKHKIIFLKSKVIASTEKNMIEPWGCRVFYSIFQRFFPKKFRVFLQHGILDKDVSEVYGKNVSNIDLFVTSTSREQEFVINNFGYSRNEIANVGICRYDKLLELRKEKKQENIILYIPTWRRDLFDLTKIHDEKYIKEARKEFVTSKYYKSIQDIINNAKLNYILEKYHYKFIMVTHHGINKLADLFNTKFSNIEIYKSEEVTIQQLLAKSKVFITDYSSIHFDSGYIRNRNIYYQFDKEEFYKNHAGKSYFDYVRDGFGPVVNTKEELISVINKNINGDYEEKKYADRADKFFQFYDNNNSKRLYEVILSKLK